MSKTNLTTLNKVSLLAYLINLGISVPHYCYHNNLSIAGNCRMCIVEMGKMNKPIVACAVSAGTSLFNHEIYHNSGLVKKARENVMEFLLLNHPLDCPICDQGGECDLQENSQKYGSDKSRNFRYMRRAVKNKNLGFIIKTEMNRCIHCEGCTRFYSVMTGKPLLGTLGRG